MRTNHLYEVLHVQTFSKNQQMEQPLVYLRNFFVYKILFLGAAIFIPEIFFLNSVAVRYTKNRVENWEPPARSVKINMSGLN